MNNTIKGRTTYLSNRTYNEIKILAIKNETTISKFIESILSDYIKNSKSDS
jgi:hypothetical protein